MASLYSKSWTKLQIEEIAAAEVKGHSVSCGTFRNFIIKSVSNRIIVLQKVQAKSIIIKLNRRYQIPAILRCLNHI